MSRIGASCSSRSQLEKSFIQRHFLRFPVFSQTKICVSKPNQTVTKPKVEKLRNSAFSFHWLGSSIFRCLFVCRPSRIGNTSFHLHYMMFQTIQTIFSELSPVYCCLVTQISKKKDYFRDIYFLFGLVLVKLSF